MKLSPSRSIGMHNAFYRKELNKIDMQSDSALIVPFKISIWPIYLDSNITRLCCRVLGQFSYKVLTEINPSEVEALLLFWPAEEFV